MFDRFRKFWRMDFIILSFLTCFLFFRAPLAQAATLFMLPKVSEYKVGQTFDLDLRINSEGQGFNAAQATILFPKNLLEVKAIDTSSSSTVFNFWLDEPKFSNAEGKITFIGGATNGVVGASIGILKITFATLGSGEGDIVISDAAVTASDGSGTNILSTIGTARVRVVPNVLNQTLPTTSIQSPIIPTPTLVVRKPVLVEGLPTKPKIIVPLYPDQTEWYNSTTDFVAQWVLPSDVSGVSVVLDKDVNTIPSEKSDGVFDSKIFGALKDGISYLHVRFKNNVGWGPVAHYRLAIDTMPPLPFVVDSSSNFKTDNPTPEMFFSASDGLSGMDYYLLRVDDQPEIKTSQGKVTLGLQVPGKFLVLVKAVDRAGNIREAAHELEILPIASPFITNIETDLFSSGKGFEISGRAEVGDRVLVVLRNVDGSVVYSTQVPIDSNHNWFLLVNQPFVKGDYFVEVTAQDKRGAMSLPVSSAQFSSRVGQLNLWFLILLLGLMAGVFILVRVPIALVKKAPPLFNLRRWVERGFLALMGDPFRYYEGSLRSLTRGFDYIKDHVVVTDARGSILYANKAMEEMTGFSQEEVIGKNPGDLWGSNMPEEFYRKMWHTIKVKKKPFVGKVRNKRKDGTYYWQELRVSPVLDENYEAKYFIGIEPHVATGK